VVNKNRFISFSSKAFLNWVRDTSLVIVKCIEQSLEGFVLLALSETP